MEYKENILNFSLDEETRIENLEKYEKENKNDCFEVGNRICGMYEFNGIKNIEHFLFSICLSHVKVSLFLKFQACKSLLFFSEIKDIIDDKLDENEKIIKEENNAQIDIRNKMRQEKAYTALDIFCSQFEDTDIEKLPIPCQVEAICMLMMNDNYKHKSDHYFRKIIDNTEIDSDYRYKIILSLENKNILNSLFYLKNSCFDFLHNTNNRTMYRILSGQYLLQKCNLDMDEKIIAENILLSFAEDNDLDYDLRGDAADTLLNLGSDYYRNKARNIILLLGHIEGSIKTIYDNKQNVHATNIENSVKDILISCATIPILKIGDNEIDFDIVCSQIEKILKEEYNCSECIIDTQNSENNKYCSEPCKEMFLKHSKIRTSLNRICVDRTLYMNNSLNNLLIKLWSYISRHEYKNEMIKRLIQELEDMSGTCSSGFLSRLLNTISGFGEFNISISFEDQLIANFTARLNFYAKKITEHHSIFYNEKLNDVMEIFINSNLPIKNSIIHSISKTKILTDLPPLKKIIEQYLITDKDMKINNAVETFSENVFNEMMLDPGKYHDRQNFSLFFRTYLLRIREELYEEFKDFMDDSLFDLTIRKAISLYEGLQNFC
jgi:hypothetical protein